MFAVAFLLFSATSCDRVDKAFEAVDKAKNLKTEFDKKADEVKKEMSEKAEAFGEKVKKSADTLGSQYGKDDKDSENKSKSQNEEKGRRGNKELD
jgi:Skp family chaperone for outer membrane proteins